jgi:hypothetical protein
MVGVLPGDLTKKDFETVSSGDITGNKIEKPHSYHDAGEYSLLFEKNKFYDEV